MVGQYQLEELSIELSNACNLSCRHCSSGAGVKAAKGELGFGEIVWLMTSAKKMGASVLSLSGGDPIVHERLVDIVAAAARLEFEQILVYTTGIWDVDYAYARGLVNAPTGPGRPASWQTERFGLSGIDTYPHIDELLAYKSAGLKFVFSLDSYEATTMDFVRGLPGAWRMVTNGIQYLTNRGVSVWAHYVPMCVNINDFVAVRRLCNALGVEKLGVLRFVPQTRGYANRDVLLPTVQQFSEFLRTVDLEMAEHAQELPAVRLGCPAEFRHAVPGTSVNVADTGKAKLCHAGKDLMLVRPTGAAHPCAAWKSLPTDSNVRNKQLEDIWENDQTFNSIRYYLGEGYNDLQGACATCGYLQSCRGGCPAQRLHAFGKRLDDLMYPEADPLCPTRITDLERHANSVLNGAGASLL